MVKSDRERVDKELARDQSDRDKVAEALIKYNERLKNRFWSFGSKVSNWCPA
jgi:hypothetical protein